jgi:pc22g03720 protein
MHTPTRTACRPLSSLALMAALGALPLAVSAQQGTPAATTQTSVAPQTTGQPAPQPAPQNVAQTASQPGSQTSGQGGAQPSAASPAAASAVTSPAAPAVPSAAGTPAATPPAAPQAAPQSAGSAQPAPSPAASSTPTARLPSTGTPPTQPANSANRLPAAPDTADTAKQARNCYVPDDLLSEPGRLPGLSAALVRGKGDLLVIMLGSESTNPSPARPASVPSNTANSDAGGSVSSRLRATLAAAARNPLAERLEERLIQDLGPLPGRTIHVESVGRRNSTVAEQASLINKQVLPRKPALVIWNLGRTDTRRGLPPANMARALDRGLEQLRRQHIDTIVMDPPYHPQFEAFYRTDDYRQYIRWTMNLHDQPYLQRYDMIDYWASTGRIDLDSGEPDRQAAAVTFTETCIAYQLSRMIDRGLSRK